MTGDLQSVDVQRQLYLKPVTSRRFRQLTTTYKLFCIPSLSVDNPNETKPLYYDINCTQQSLHLTVTFDYDKNSKEILVVSVIPPQKCHYIGNRRKLPNTSKYQGRSYSSINRRSISSRNPT